MLGFDSNTSKQSGPADDRLRSNLRKCRVRTRHRQEVPAMLTFWHLPSNADHWISPSSLNRASSVLIAQFHSPIIKLDSPPTQVVTPFRTKLQFWTKTGLLRYSSEPKQTLTESDWSEILDIYFLSLISTPCFQPKQPEKRLIQFRTKISAYA